MKTILITIFLILCFTASTYSQTYYPKLARVIVDSLVRGDTTHTYRFKNVYDYAEITIINRADTTSATTADNVYVQNTKYQKNSNTVKLGLIDTARVGVQNTTSGAFAAVMTVAEDAVTTFRPLETLDELALRRINTGRTEGNDYTVYIIRLFSSRNE